MRPIAQVLKYLKHICDSFVLLIVRSFYQPRSRTEEVYISQRAAAFGRNHENPVSGSSNNSERHELITEDCLTIRAASAFNWINRSICVKLSGSCDETGTYFEHLRAIKGCNSIFSPLIHKNRTELYINLLQWYSEKWEGYRKPTLCAVISKEFTWKGLSS